VTGARRAVVAAILVASPACGIGGADIATPDPFEQVMVGQPQALPEPDRVSPGRPGEGGGIVLEPVSRAIDHATIYHFSLGHCGLLSPIDVDGSFWDPLDGVTAGGAPLDLENGSEMINGTPGTLVVIGDEARFRTEGGSVLRLARHDGRKEFPGCD
jgi:hypothetical protein